MRLEAKKYLLDIQQAAALASEFVAGRTFADYQATAMLRAAVERQCEIIGEALTKLAKVDESVAARISEYRRIIACPLVRGPGFAKMAVDGDRHKVSQGDYSAIGPVNSERPPGGIA